MPRTQKGPAAKQVELDGVYLTRYENLSKLKDMHGGPTRVALKLGHTNGSLLSQISGPHPSRIIGEKLARTIEEKLGYADGYLDKPHTGAPKPRGPTQDDPMLYGQCVGVVMGLAQALQVELSGQKRDAIVAMALEEAQRTGEVRPEYVERLFKIAT